MLLLISLLACSDRAPDPGAEASYIADGTVDWQPWSDEVFERAGDEDRLVLLHLGTEWCHWCHVMRGTTYRDPGVLEVIDASYLPVRVDADARPDLATRYEDHGWPATVIFDASGTELAKLRGYFDADVHRARLAAFAEDPTPGPSILAGQDISWGDAAVLHEDDRLELLARIDRGWDPVHGGWGDVHKYLDPDLVEHGLLAGRAGDRTSADRAQLVLDLQQKHLHDPVWGGVYQYSDGGVWDSPHYEKIMPFQAGNLRVYSQAAALEPDSPHAQTAASIVAYLDRFLTAPDGAYYTSQDADLVPGQHSGGYFALGDAQRTSLGIPRVDTHIYARDNGLAIQALLSHHRATGDPASLQRALRAAARIERSHRRVDGGYHHSPDDPRAYLHDSVAMGRATLALYTATSDETWLDHSAQTAQFVASTFQEPDAPGLLASAPGGPLEPVRQRDENIAAARWLELLAAHTGRAEHAELAESVRRYLFTPDIARQARIGVGGVLLVDREARLGALQVVIIGPESEAAHDLYTTALRDPEPMLRLERWTHPEQPVPNHDFAYPWHDEATAYVCRAGRCAAPVHEPEALAASMAAVGGD